MLVLSYMCSHPLDLLKIVKFSISENKTLKNFKIWTKIAGIGPNHASFHYQFAIFIAKNDSSVNGGGTKRKLNFQ